MRITFENNVLSFIPTNEGEKRELSEYAAAAEASAAANDGSVPGGRHFFGKALVISLAD